MEKYNKKVKLWGKNWKTDVKCDKKWGKHVKPMDIGKLKTNVKMWRKLKTNVQLWRRWDTKSGKM